MKVLIPSPLLSYTNQREVDADGATLAALLADLKQRGLLDSTLVIWASEFGRNLVVSPYTLALLIGMSVTDTSQKAIANLGMDEVKFTAPVFAGDTVYGESEVLEKRESKSRPGQGIVTIVTRGHNQDGVMICTFKRNMLIPSRGNAVEDRVSNY